MQITDIQMLCACRGAFKFRGAYNAVSLLSPEEAAKGVVTHRCVGETSGRRELKWEQEAMWLWTPASSAR